MSGRVIVAGRSRQFLTRVSDRDYDFLQQWLWTFARSHIGGELYYIRRSLRVDGRNITILMHRLIMIECCGEPPPSSKHTVHHRDGDSLNNQRENLRWVTHAENMRERLALLAMRRLDTLLTDKPAQAPIARGPPIDGRDLGPIIHDLAR